MEDIAGIGNTAKQEMRFVASTYELKYTPPQVTV